MEEPVLVVVVESTRLLPMHKQSIGQPAILSRMCKEVTMTI